jgi:hypothetical protein
MVFFNPTSGQSSFLAYAIRSLSMYNWIMHTM